MDVVQNERELVGAQEYIENGVVVESIIECEADMGVRLFDDDLVVGRIECPN